MYGWSLISTGSTSTNTVNETVTAKTLTVTGITASNKTFDGTTAATPWSGRPCGGDEAFISPDVVTLVTTGAGGHVLPALPWATTSRCRSLV